MGRLPSELYRKGGGISNYEYEEIAAFYRWRDRLEEEAIEKARRK